MERNSYCQNILCKYVHKFSKERWKTLGKNQIKYCSIKLTSIVDDMLHNKKIILNLLIQVVYIAYLINKEGY